MSRFSRVAASGSKYSTASAATKPLSTELVPEPGLVLDRDPLYTAQFRAALERAGIEVIRRPPRSPNLNAFAERFVLSIRRECLDRILPLGERHLRRVISEFLEHYHRERNHQGIGNRLIVAAPEPANTNGRILRKDRLGGLLNFYHRAA